MQQLESLFDELSDGICVSDGDGNVLYMNQAAKKILDVPTPPKETLNTCQLLCGRLFASGPEACAQRCALRKHDSPETAITFVGRHGPRSSFQWSNSQVNHIERWGHLRVRCLKASGRWVGLEDEERHFTIIEDASAELDLSRRKEDWRRMVAHDLRSPLTSILATLRVLQDIPPGQGIGEKQSQFIEISVRSCQLITELLDLFLDLAKLDEGVMPVNEEYVPLLALARKAADDQAAFSASKRISLEVAGDEAVAAAADSHLLARIAQNILNNAVKYTPEEGRITISVARSEGGVVTLSVRDTGLGIAPEELPLIFNRFYQAQERREGKIKGTGLGLAFCREAAKAMHGEMSVSSRLGKGSEFTVRLPAAATLAAEVPPQSPRN